MQQEDGVISVYIYNAYILLESGESVTDNKLSMVLSVTLKSNPTKTRYTLHNHQLLSVHSAKYLGVTIDSKLS